MKEWFQYFVACSEAVIKEHCHQILRRLLTFLEAAIFGSSNYISFDNSVLDYCYSSDFDELVVMLHNDLKT